MNIIRCYQAFKKYTITKILGVYLICLLVLAGCTPEPKRYSLQQDTGPVFTVNIERIRNAIPQDEPLSRYGNPKTYTVLGKRYNTLPSARGYKARGIASWYGMKFQSYLTSNREAYDLLKMTAAHRTLPIPTYVKVTNLSNGKTVIVRINDRGPFISNRIIDLSYVAAKKLDMLKTGTAFVEIQAIIPKKRIRLFQSGSKIGHNHNRAQIYRIQTQKTWIHIERFRIRQNAQYIAKYIYAITKRPTQVQTFKKKFFTYYRILIGPFENTAQTIHIQERLKKKGFRPILVKTR